MIRSKKGNKNNRKAEKIRRKGKVKISDNGSR